MSASDELDALLKKATRADLEALIRERAGWACASTCFDLRRVIGQRRLDTIEAQIKTNDRAFHRAAARRQLAELDAISAKNKRLNAEWQRAMKFTYPEREATS